VTFTPASYYNGSDSFTFKVNDGSANSATATVSITVTAMNDAPTATAQSVTTDEDTAKAITLSGSDPDGDSLTYEIVTGPAHGTLTGTAPNITYTPAANYYGSDSFTFKVKDGSANSAAATVSITVAAVNDAPVAAPQSVTTDEDTAKEITLGGSDLEGDSLTYSIATGPAHGTLGLISGNKVTYTPAADYAGPDSFTFKVNDGTTLSAAATVSITVTAVNDAPTATAQSVTTNEDTAKAITLAGTDAENSALTFETVTGPAHGILSGTGATVTYTPAANYNGSDSFTFRVNDGTTDSATATVSITVTAANDAPTATAQSVTTDEDTAKEITMAGSDIDGDALTYIIATNPAHGTLSLVSGAKVTYTPAPDYNGADSFTFKVNDGAADSATVTVDITVAVVNDAPVAAAQTVTTDEDTAAAMTLTGSDAEDSTLVYSVVTNPAHGTLTGTGANLTYTPAADYNGTDSFTFKVNDGAMDSAPATVTITITSVNDAPTAETQSVTTDEDTAKEITMAGSDVDGDILTYSIMTEPAHGTLGAVSGSKVTYTPAADYNGSDSFTFKVNDDTADSATVTIDISITASNDAPVLAAINNKNVDELTELSFTARADDVDDTADALTFSLIGAPEGASIDEDTGDFTWTPTEAQSGIHSFTVVVSDDGGLSDSETITVTVAEVNTAPVLAVIGDKTVGELSTLSFTAAASDGDLPANTLTFTLEGTVPEGASMTEAGVFSWTPTTAQSHETYTFTVKVSDGTASDTKTFTVTVTDINTAPVLSAIDPLSVNELMPLTFTATAADSDEPANSLTFSITGAPAGAAIDEDTGVFTWTPGENQDGTYTVTVVVSDGSLTASVNVEITVNEVNTAPVLGAIGDRTFDERVPMTFTATASDSDLPANTLTFSLENAPEGAAINPTTGVFTWTPREDQDGIHTFTIIVSDNTATDSTATDSEKVIFTVNEVAISADRVDVTGPASLEIPVALDLTQSYTASVYDQYGDPMPASVTWGLVGAPVGVTIDSLTGVLTVLTTAVPGTFDVVASSGAAQGSVEVSLDYAAAVPTSIGFTKGSGSITIPAIVSITEDYDAAILDQYGRPIDSAAVFTWALETAVTGVGIDAATGTVTIDKEAGEGPFTIVVTDGTLSGTKTVTLTLLPTYTVTFVNYDGSVHDTQTVMEGLGATAPETDPVRPADAQYTYTFTGWDVDFSSITGPLTVTALYTSTVNSYTVTFTDYNGRVLKTETVSYGSAATAPPEPTPPIFEGYIFVFSVWSERFDNITRDLTVRAVYYVTAEEAEEDEAVLGETASFDDVTEDDWFFEAVQYVVNEGLFGGTTDTTFEPYTKMTRGMLVTVLHRLEGKPAPGTENPFSDVAAGQYYTDAVLWASGEGIVEGYDGEFFPDLVITREQLAVILYRYAAYKGYNVTASADLTAFADASQISGYAVEELQWAVGAGLIGGKTPTTLAPTDTASRAEVAQTLMKFMEAFVK
jgi:VCBS repeat-containing protein